MSLLRKTTKLLGLLSLSAAFGKALSAHEFWIDPVAFNLPRSAPLVADIRVGQNFEGAAYSYFPKRFKRFEVITENIRQPVLGRLGDRPALNQPAAATGLNIIAHVTDNQSLVYHEWAKFKAFAEHKNFTGAIAEHQRRGLPKTGFKERYSRYAKSLIAVGDGAGSDHKLGLLTEIVAEANPYTDDLSTGLPMRVYYRGQPRANAQVELFAKASDGHVTISLHITDETGLVRLPVKAGWRYLADAVVLRALDPATAKGAVWESLWASLTFAIPE